VTRRVLLVDDEPEFLRTLATGLRGAGYEIETAESAAAALAAARNHEPDAVVLDLLLPDGRGTDVCASLRTWSAVPIVVVSAVGEEPEKIAALDAGADDYVTKPFGMDELLARMRAVVRRSAVEPDEPQIRLGGLIVDLAAKRVTNGQRDIRLTPTEWHLLEVLLKHPGKLLSQRQLLQEVWGPGYADATGNLRLYMAQLRRKLEPDPARPRWLLTEPGMGYRFEPDAATLRQTD
jgi:two-component system KDP operon response regulator KdpE